RAMGPQDLDEVIALEPELFGAGAWSRGVYQEELSRTDRYYLVVTDPHVIGYAGLALGAEATVMTIGVAGTHHRQGQGGLMITALLDKGGGTGEESVSLEVRAHDDGAQALYTSFV